MQQPGSALSTCRPMSGRHASWAEQERDSWQQAVPNAATHEKGDPPGGARWQQSGQIWRSNGIPPRMPPSRPQTSPAAAIGECGGCVTSPPAITPTNGLPPSTPELPIRVAVPSAASFGSVRAIAWLAWFQPLPRSGTPHATVTSRPSSARPAARKRVWWQHETPEGAVHEWPTRVYQRTLHAYGHGCPICVGRKPLVAKLQ